MVRNKQDFPTEWALCFGDDETSHPEVVSDELTARKAGPETDGSARNPLSRHGTLHPDHTESVTHRPM